jgi:hypothetical protein
MLTLNAKKWFTLFLSLSLLQYSKRYFMFHLKTDNLWKIRFLKTWDNLSLQFNSILQLTDNVEIITKKTFNNFFREFIERSGARLVSIPDAIYDSDLIIVAVPKDFYKVTKPLIHYCFCLIIYLKLICAYNFNSSSNRAAK